MNLKYMKVSLFEISYKKNELFHDILIIEMHLYIYIYTALFILLIFPSKNSQNSNLSLK